jgi:hypothetical protein
LPSTVIASREFHPAAVYRINVDNDGDAMAEIAFTSPDRAATRSLPISREHYTDSGGLGTTTSPETTSCQSR